MQLLGKGVTTLDFQGFTKQDFEVFEVPGLELRMEALKSSLRPKLEQLGRDISEFLSNELHQPVYPHVARHARRTVNPPNDSWVAFCHDKRGYKKHPHFQIGTWQTHAFATFGMIYESPYRTAYAEQLKTHAHEVLSTIPKNYVWIPNHMDPNVIPASEVTPAKLKELANRLAGSRQGELLVGLKIEKEEAVRMSAEAFEDVVKTCFSSLQPLYQLSMNEVIFS
jgi:uncharacterized protein YktB (UPF0637 family)